MTTIIALLIGVVIGVPIGMYVIVWIIIYRSRNDDYIYGEWRKRR